MSTLAELIARAKDAKEPQPQPDGQYKVTITHMEEKFGKTSGKPYLNVLFSFDNPEKVPAQTLGHMFMYEDPEQTEDTNERRALEMKQFIEAFEINAEVLAEKRFDEIKGKKGWVIVSEKDEGEYGLRNRINKFVKS